MSHFLVGKQSGTEAGGVRFNHLYMWAERGLIRIVDERTGEREIVSVHSTLERIRALSDMVKNSRRQREKGSHDPFDDQKLDEIQAMIEGMVTVCRTAKVQGMPTDPSARRDLVRRRPSTYVVPDLGPIGATI